MNCKFLLKKKKEYNFKKVETGYLIHTIISETIYNSWEITRQLHHYTYNIL